MAIAKIIIENYKSIRKAEIELNPINVLIGANGAGKSNFITFFTLVKKILQQNLQYYLASQGYASNVLFFGAKYSNHLSGKLIFKKSRAKTPINFYAFKLAPNNQGQLFFQEELLGYNRKAKEEDTEWSSTHNTPPGYPESILPSTYEPWRARYIKNQIEGYEVYHFNDSGPEAKIRQACRINDNLKLHRDGSNLAAMLYLFQKTKPASFSLIENVIRSVAPFFDHFVLHPDKFNNSLISLRWREKGSDELFDIQHFSDGTLRFIALTTLLLQPNPPATLIIDEPELGLHPSALGKLAGLVQSIAARGTQVILSTQSPNFISEFEPEDILVTERVQVNGTGKSASIFKRFSAQQLEDWLTDYSLGEIWEKNIIGGRP